MKSVHKAQYKKHKEENCHEIVKPQQGKSALIPRSLSLVVLLFSQQKKKQLGHSSAVLFGRVKK